MFRFFHAESKTIIGAATIVGIFSFLADFVGFIRDRVLAGMFGAGATLDVYYAAFKIPDFLFSLIVIGAISSSFIPLFTKNYFSERRESAWEFTNSILHLIGGGMLVASILLFIFAHPLSTLIAPGFDPLKQSQVAEFMRVMLCAQMLLAFSLIFGSVLQGLKRFFLYALAPVLYNLGIILGALVFAKIWGPIGLAWGVVLGAALHLCTQCIGSVAAGYSYHFRFNLKDQEARKMLMMTGPRILGIAIAQLLFLVLTVFATTMSAGSLTIFQFAYNIQFFAVGTIGVSFAIAAFPTFSEALSKDDPDGFRRSFASTIRQILFFMIPLMMLFLILRAQIVRVVVGAGAFDWQATILTADTLAFFALTFIPQAFVYVLARAFFALHDTVTPLTAGLVAGLVGVISAFLFAPHFGVIGLGMAFSLSAVVNAVLLWVPLRQRMQSLHEATILQSLLKLSVAGIACGLVMQGLKPVVLHFLSLETFFGVLFQGILAGGAGFVVYLLIAWFLKVEELHSFLAVLQRKFLRKIRLDETVSLPK
ncbi:MAG: murein biosynthesis integral membrane protein MurJ [Patescibacteria group bacterium]